MLRGREDFDIKEKFSLIMTTIIINGHTLARNTLPGKMKFTTRHSLACHYHILSLYDVIVSSREDMKFTIFVGPSMVYITNTCIYIYSVCLIYACGYRRFLI